ncbi:MAG TPA: TonB-dependent receptor [bacterium]|nr:TonB-dependent receptor [bacterium]HPN45072.1 TonB-dependent receptor [bacterium]
MKKLYQFTVVLVFCYALTSFPVIAGTMTGRVLDIVTRQPMPDVNVQVQGQAAGAATNTDGVFQINNLPAGVYTLVVSCMGYRAEIIPDLRLVNESDKNVEILLTPTVVEGKSVMVTASRSRSLLRDMPVSGAIISTAELQNKTPLTLAEAMAPVSGATFKAYGQTGAMETLSLRGSSYEQVLILWDGQRINSPLNGGIDLGIIPLQSIEKIEVVQDGYSSLYGADAMAGVVNLVSKEPAADGALHGSLNAMVGSFGLSKEELSINQGLGAVSYMLAAHRTDSDGDFDYRTPAAPGGAAKTLQRENSALEQNAVFGRLAWTISPATTINALGEWTSTERGIPGALNNPTVNGSQEDETARYHLNVAHRQSRAWALRVNSFYHTHNVHYIDENPWWPTDSHNDAASAGASLQNDLQFSRQKFIAGATFQQDNGTGKDVGEHERSNTALFAHGEFHLLPAMSSLSLFVMPAIRYDHFSDFGNTINPRLGVLLARPGAAYLGVRGSIGRSFRAPTFNDLYWNEDMYTKGNPDLKVESSDNYEFGLRGALPVIGGLSIDACYFHKDAKDLINWGVDAASGKWMPQNVSAAQLSGGEFSLSLPHISRYFSLDMNVTRLSAINKSGVAGVNDKQLIYRAPWSTGVVGGAAWKSLHITLTMTYLDKRYADEMNTKRLDACTLLNADLALRPLPYLKHVSLVLSVLNVADKDYILVDSYPMPGRMLRVRTGIEL